MALKIPDSMDELVYWTSRKIDSGYVKAWVERENCPKCEKGLMGKPVVKGKVKIRASEYVCPECSHTVPKQEYEDTLTASILYTCPHCGNKGEARVPFKRKKYQGADAIVFSCGKCSEKIPITKKLKDI
ncbi:TPA: hypothetical protein HA239_03445 [Candidatus Woesearchaeota archaeon]|nr:hypothetical protein QT06_C0001G0025 [archaeon GW2011_AR15]MBS3104164.1 hypothetical protein [Candidatus Woesearchaeota archaeon]HIH41444.1 hypothetical protein [Candidatus Woesearchaeota archaeon]